MFHCGIISNKKKLKFNFTNSLGNKACASSPKLKQANFRFFRFLSYFSIVIIHAFADGLQHGLLNHLLIHASPLLLLLLLPALLA